MGSKSPVASPNSLSKPATPEGTSKKKNIIKDIFGSDEESEMPTEDRLKPPVVVDAALISSIEENLAEEREKFEEEKKIALKEELRQEVEDYSDVSDKDIEESREVRMRELSVSPINSDQSESFEKAATLEGLNPEAISPEEDFTSLSEEEEGEIKNYERRRKLKLRKRELQKKVRELERQVIEISPSRAAVIANGGNLENGEINEEKKKKKPKEKEKAKKKVKKDASDDVPKESKKVDETVENSSKPSRSYRKKEAGEEDKDEEKEGSKAKPARR